MLENTNSAAEIEALKAQLKDCQDTISELRKLNEWYEKQLKLNRQKMFGASSEKSEYAGAGRINMFNEAEAEREAISPEPTLETITYKRKNKRAAEKRSLRSFLPKRLNTSFPTGNKSAKNAAALCMS